MKLFKKDKGKEKGKGKEKSSPQAAKKSSIPPRKIFIVVSQRENYYSLFADVTLDDGTPIEVDQAPWMDIDVTSFSDSPNKPLIQIKPNARPFPDVPQQGKSRTFSPDFILIRSYILGNYEHDWRKKFFALYHSNVPCLNSLDSWLFAIEKATLYGKLMRVKAKDPTFPLIPETYYSSPAVATFPPDFPCVLKVGSSSQGVGKAKIHSQDQWNDALSLMQMTRGEYFVSQPFIQWKSDVRVQKIGSKYRAIERRITEGGESLGAWKANEGIGVDEQDVEVKDTWRKWLDEASAELQMEICGMDLIADAQGKEYILELNSSSIGFPERHRKEDVGAIKDLMLQKMNQLYSKAPKKPEEKEEKEEKKK
eukprot:TRINITY_DN14695_c0_g1_i1.p1 TRINITY_DN14695_c0_g1~~TRINITY_DN14695_c0_g1_i1.p1  ORF type:complete len:366 (-),score=87.73 TRINITY_DN14695_c0_g1_i1:20-1117(-)